MKSRLLQIVPPRAALAVLALVLLDSMGSGRARLDPEGGAAPAVRAGARPVPERAPQAGMPADGDIDLTRLQRTPNEHTIVDLFAPPAAPPPPGATDAPPPPPAAPALPFTYLGKTIDGDKLTVFVARGEEHYTLAPGQTIDSMYRVEKITAAVVTFKYLPLGTRQTLAIPTPH